jgi:hypothetical protein
MDTRKSYRRLLSICLYFSIIGFIILIATGCTGGTSLLTASPTVSATATAELKPVFTPQPSHTFTQAVPTSTLVCTDDLSFLNDLTIPDGTIVQPGSSLDKQWQIQNNGSCNWDDRYRLRLIAGDSLGATPEHTLFPARAGSQAVIRIKFSAPQSPGVYVSEWQAYNPDGLPFGQSFFIKIVVQ